MRILNAGVDGSRGWFLAQHLAEREVAGADALLRRSWVDARVLSLPLYAAMSDANIDRVTGSVIDLLRRYA